jgi:thiol-disulfide isomerase/thioredoxin
VRRIVVAALFALGFCVPGAHAADSATALFAATMIDAQGEATELSRFRGQALIVNFWARWCVPCRAEFPELTALQEKYAGQKLVVLGVALEEDPAKVREFLAAYGVKYPVALARAQGIPLMQALGNAEAVLPFTLIVDRNGDILLRKRGPFTQKDFQTVAGRLLP